MFFATCFFEGANADTTVEGEGEAEVTTDPPVVIFALTYAITTVKTNLRPWDTLQMVVTQTLQPRER